MKKINKILLLLALVVLTALAVTACGGEESLSVKEGRMPQLVHVQGEELNLSDGVLLYTNGDSSEDVAMNAEGVEVSGFDKNTLGEQTVTVKYGEATTTIKVTVVPRMTITDYTADYLIGDEFDAGNGTLKITRNDGTNFTVILKSNKVSVEGFDSSAAGDLNLTAKYTNGSTVYTCEFPVKVYAIDNITFKAPNKVAYNSHDGALDVSGGYFTLSGKDGTLKRDVPLTIDMVSGYNIGLVNETNSPLTQQLTVTYGEKTDVYSVKLIYTDISLFKKNVVPLLSYNWEVSSEEEPTLTAEQGTMALAMMEKYMDMSPAERAFITDEETLAMARAAMSYGFAAWAEEIQKYDNAFAIEYGELVFKCESREALIAAIEGLADTTSPLYTYSPILLGMMEMFAEENVNTDYLFSDYPVIENETYAGLTAIFEYMLELDTLADEIGADWSEVGANVYADKIEAVYNSIVAGGYMDYTFREIFYYVSYWRANDDLFEALYAYYYGKSDTEAITNLSAVRFPGKLEELYSYLVVALDQINQRASYGVVDVSEFMYNYHMALRLTDEIAATDDELIKYLYENIAINAMLGVESDVGLGFDTMLAYLRTVEGGFYYSSGALLGVEEYHTLMEKYMAIVIRLFEDEAYGDSDEYNADIEEMFSYYMNLSSSAQFNFLGTLNAFYGMGLPPIAFEGSAEYEAFSCVFINLINDYFKAKFATDLGKQLYIDLVVAVELYGQRYTNETWLESFTARMDAIAAALAELSDEDEAVFNTYLAAIYEKYVSIRADFIESTVAPDLGEWEDEFQALEDAVVDVEMFAMFINEGYTFYNLFFASFEKLTALSNSLLETAPPEIIAIYYNSPLYSTNELGSRLDPDADFSGVDEILWTYDYVISIYRGMYINYLLSFQDTSIYDVYLENDMATLLENYAELVWVYLNSPEDAEVPFNKEAVLALMKEFASRDAEGQMLFILMDEVQNNFFYYMALEAFIVQEYGEEGLLVDTVTKLIELEQLYVFYECYKDAETYEEMKTALADLKELYAALSAEDPTAFADFEEIYRIDTEKCEASIAAAEAEEEPEN